MNTELDTSPSTVVAPAEHPDHKWVAWGIWTVLSLVLVLFAVLGLGVNSGLLPGWAAGVIVSAMMMVFGRK